MKQGGCITRFAGATIIVRGAGRLLDSISSLRRATIIARGAQPLAARGMTHRIGGENTQGDEAQVDTRSAA